MSLAVMIAIQADLDRHRHPFDMTRDNLGQDLCKAATDGCQECIAREESPDGSPWAPLSKDYAEWKAFHYPGSPIGVVHLVMANPREVAGEVIATPNKAEVTYGVSGQAKQEASWFQEGDPAHNRPPRRFWGFTRDSLATVRVILDRRFATA